MNIKQGFYRRTRRGQVIRIVKEKYIQSQSAIGYGYLGGAMITKSALRNLLQDSTHQCLLVIDTNIALHQIDVLEYKSPITSLMVVPQTVLQEVRHRNLAVYRRLLALLHDEQRQVIFYPNEVSESTFTLRSHNEIVNDYHDRCIREVVLFYQHALQPQTKSSPKSSLHESNMGAVIGAELDSESSDHEAHTDDTSDSNDDSNDEDDDTDDSDDSDYDSDVGGKSKSFGSVILLTNDKENRVRALQEGIQQVVNIHEFITSHSVKYPELVDLVSYDHAASAAADDHEEVGRVSGKRKHLFRHHWSEQAMQTGIKSKKLLKGVLRVRRDDINDCYVLFHEGDRSSQTTNTTNTNQAAAGRRSIRVCGAQFVNRAVDGDLVAVEPLAEEEALKALEVSRTNISGAIAVGVAAETAEAPDELMEGVESANSGQSTVVESSTKTLTCANAEFGRVVGIVRRQWRQYAGSIDTSYGDEVVPDAPMLASAMIFRAVDRRVPPIRILVSAARRDEFIGSRIIVAIDKWSLESKFPVGHFVRNLGTIGEKSVENAVLLHEFGVASEGFSKSVMNCLPPPDWQITEDIVAQRTDLRHLPVVSVDPPGCKDIDDALHCIELPNGNLQVGVHIADVTYFVHPDSPLDLEAAKRSTSTYLVERRLDMLPGLLTTQLCSLRSNEPHLAFSVLWEMDKQGNILGVSFCKSCILSVASLTYADAQEMIDHPNQQDPVNKSINLLAVIARILRQRRIDMGALTLASPEVRFKLDLETDNPTDVSMYALKESNSMVEEFMLLANITVAKKILMHFPSLAVLRRHQPPSQQQFAPLVSAAAAVGVRLDISSSKALADSLDAAVKPGDEYFNKLLRIMSTRCMMPAQYFCSGVLPKESWHHYGLAAPVYTHFTSPIRRYADVIVHRLLAATIGVIPLPPANADRPRQQDLCSHMNRKHKSAQMSQRASVQLYTLLYFKHKPSVEKAYVMAVAADRIDVIVPRFGIEGSIALEPIANDQGATLEYASGTHTIAMVNTSSRADVLRVQVFGSVFVRLTVQENTAGSRSLLMTLLLPSENPELLVGPVVAVPSVTSTCDKLDASSTSEEIVVDDSIKVVEDDDIEEADDIDRDNNEPSMLLTPGIRKRKIKAIGTAYQQAVQADIKLGGKRKKLRQPK